MKVIEPSVEILKQEDFSIKGIKKFIEQCARLSYKSEDKITDDSYEKFVQMLIDKDHARPLEFGTVHLEIDVCSRDIIIDTLTNRGMLNQLWWKETYKNGKVYVTTNYRYYLAIKKVYPNIDKYFTEEDNKYYPKRYTVHMILDRGVMDEFRTHIALSSIAESTRYCNYSKGKFGNEITCVIPRFITDITDDIKKSCTTISWRMWMEQSEQAYLSAIKTGWTPQQARGFLPLDVKSELIMCGFRDAWDNFFYRRCAVDAHPDARYIAEQLKDKIYEV